MQWTERRGTKSRSDALTATASGRRPWRRSLAAVAVASSILTATVVAPAAQATDQFGNETSYRYQNESCVGPENAFWWSDSSCSYPPGYSKIDSRSLNGRYRSTFQADGNWVVYDGDNAIWSSGTAGRGATNIKFQGDSNIVIYRNSVVLWSSNPRRSCSTEKGKTLTMQDDGNLVFTQDTPGDFTSPHHFTVLWSSRGGTRTSCD
ncbi:MULTISPECIES: hypothetical protein [unclassified Rathayibacter]|uniref:hypothetical protein n=1 Tax=unclassified Rathayibacter TaxID=2609250 RepID=UPI001050F5DD|nr:MULTISPECIES: hypothetical protein [unclassified Rathayibacter]TCL81709.1 D-mannose binding lectin [Rathayibacter sp. PhB192]TCM26718.1 D-mannose binding lectin [Rathayibacter sp. PhB179]